MTLTQADSTTYAAWTDDKLMMAAQRPSGSALSRAPQRGDSLVIEGEPAAMA